MEVRNYQLYNGGQEKRIQLKLNYFFSKARKTKGKQLVKEIIATWLALVKMKTK